MRMNKEEYCSAEERYRPVQQAVQASALLQAVLLQAEHH